MGREGRRARVTPERRRSLVAFVRAVRLATGTQWASETASGSTTSDARDVYEDALEQLDEALQGVSVTDLPSPADDDL